MVQYQFAYDGEKRLIDVEDATRHTLYSCPYCHDEMIPKQGIERAWHYAHKTSPCSYSNYLYTIAKERVLEWYNSSPQVLLEYKAIVSCDRRNTCLSRYCCEEVSKLVTRTFDLKSCFGRCETKYTYKKDGRSYTPDLILLRTDDSGYPPIFLEMNIKGISNEKHRMKVRTIEFEIRSEEDIRAICSSSPIKEHTRSIKDGPIASTVFHNFLVKTQIEKAEDVCQKIKESSLFSFIY